MARLLARWTQMFESGRPDPIRLGRKASQIQVYVASLVTEIQAEDGVERDWTADTDQLSFWKKLDEKYFKVLNIVNIFYFSFYSTIFWL